MIFPYIYILGIIIDQNIIWYFRDVITCDIPMGLGIWWTRCLLKPGMMGNPSHASPHYIVSSQSTWGFHRSSMARLDGQKVRRSKFLAELLRSVCCTIFLCDWKCGMSTCKFSSDIVYIIVNVSGSHHLEDRIGRIQCSTLSDGSYLRIWKVVFGRTPVCQKHHI